MLPWCLLSVAATQESEAWVVTQRRLCLLRRAPPCELSLSHRCQFDSVTTSTTKRQHQSSRYLSHKTVRCSEILNSHVLKRLFERGYPFFYFHKIRFWVLCLTMSSWLLRFWCLRWSLWQMIRLTPTPKLWCMQRYNIVAIPPHCPLWSIRVIRPGRTVCSCYCALCLCIRNPDVVSQG